MTFKFRNRVGVGLFVFVVAITAVTIVPRTTTKAQQAGGVQDRKALRLQIATLRGNLAVQEVELETEREILKQKLMRLPIAIQQVAEIRSELRMNTLPVMLDVDTKKDFMGMVRKVCGDEAAIERLSKSLDECVKSQDPDAPRKAVLKWLDGAEVWSKIEIDKELSPLKKAFASHTTENALHRFELEDLEKQYRNNP